MAQLDAEIMKIVGMIKNEAIKEYALGCARIAVTAEQAKEDVGRILAHATMYEKIQLAGMKKLALAKEVQIKSAVVTPVRRWYHWLMFWRKKNV